MNNAFLTFSFICFFLISLKAQNEIDINQIYRNWKVKPFQNADIPENESALIIYQFSKDGSVKFGTIHERNEGKFEINSGYKLKILLPYYEEIWIIKKLTSNILIASAQMGDIYLEATTNEIPELKVETLEEEIPTDVITTGYIPDKNAEKWILGSWDLEYISGAKTPENVKLRMIFNKNNTIDLMTNSKKDATIEWSFSEDKKYMTVITEDKKTDKWYFNSISESDLNLITAQFGEIVLKKTN